MGDRFIDADEIKFTDDALKKAAGIVAQFIKRQIEEGVDSSGSRFPPGVDLIASGALLASIEGTVDSGKIEIVCTVPYAPHVEARYHFMGVAPSNLRALYSALEPVLSAGAYYKDQ
jgi:hypothetical protein